MPAADVENNVERTVHVRQPVGQPVGDFPVKEIVLAERGCRTVAVPPDGGPVEQNDIVGHGPNIGGFNGLEQCIGAGCAIVPVMSIHAAVKSVARHAVDAILPPCCLSCGEVVSAGGAVCPECWNGIDFISEPYCACCALPFAYDAGPDDLCGACVSQAPAFGRARSAMVYNDVGRNLILAFKHADRTDAAPVWGEWLARAGAEILAEADALVPVPLHRRRLISRRYNQAALICFALGRVSGIPVLVDALVCVRPTPSQGRMNRRQREDNVRGAFAVRDPVRDRIAGSRIVLVDDVLTTGATLAACARAAESPCCRCGRTDARAGYPDGVGESTSVLGRGSE